jgi:hypothetical protein
MRIRGLVVGTQILSLIACVADGEGPTDNPDAAISPGADASVDARGEQTDAGPCTPGAASLVCADAVTLSLCTDDPNFDGTSDGAPRTVQIACAAFFRNVGPASCETYDDTTTEAVCTMDNGGPCGVVVATGQFTTARCTTDGAVCLLDLAAQNYTCTPDTGIVCSPTGSAFIPFCKDNLLVWRCGDDGDGIGQPHVDDCTALGNGTCDAASGKCVDIQKDGVCNLTEWICAPGLECQNDICVTI